MVGLVILLAVGGLMHAARSFVPADAVAPVAGTGLAFGHLLLTAFFSGRLAKRAGLPRLTGYILAGIAIGPHGLGLLTPAMTGELRLVSAIAVCLIALTAGGELDVRRIRPLLGTVGRITVWAVLGTAGLLSVAVFALRQWLPFLADLPAGQAAAIAAVLGIAMSSQSPAVVMALFSETRSDGPLTRTVLAVVVAADLVVIVCFALASSVAQAALVGDLDAALLVRSIAWEVLGSIGAGVAAGALLGLYLVKVGNGVDLFALLACTVMAEVGQRLHLDPLVVALAAGVFVQNVVPGGAGRLIHDIEGASLPIFIVFFGLAGANLHLAVLRETAVPALILIAVRTAGFGGGSWLATRHPDTPPVVRRHAWYGLLPQAGLALALAALVQRNLPSLGEGAAALILGMIAINELVMPVVLRRALVRSGEAGQAESHDFGEPAAEPSPSSQ